MIILREPTTFDAVAPGDVAQVTEESQKENVDAREIYAQKPYEDTRARVETSLCSELFISLRSHHILCRVLMCMCVWIRLIMVSIV